MKRAIALFELLDKYNTEKKRRRLLEQLRWPNGVACPRCGSMTVNRVESRNALDCYDCRYVFYVTSGTAMHGTHLPMNKWFAAAYFMSESKKGMSAAQTERMLGITNKTAWYLNHRIRHAVSQAERRMLSNIVEVDETWVGGKKRGRPDHRKTIVVGIIERSGDAVLEVINERDRRTLYKFVLSNVDVMSKGYTQTVGRHIEVYLITMPLTTPLGNGQGEMYTPITSKTYGPCSSVR